MPTRADPTTERRVITADDFFAEADELRRVFDERLGERRGVPRERFVWDYWHVPEQYTYVRTFADEFFPDELFGRFCERLRAWGRQQLGCTGMVPPWLSYYIDGCRQELHADVPHGQWAFVFSLTNWDERTFTGGETFLLRPETLDFWRTFGERRVSELDSFVDLIEPRFNRLTVFDPRIPHGVREVEGTREPLDSRIAIHGWFNEPGLVLSEALEDQRPVLEATAAMLGVSLRGVTGVEGLVAARIDVTPEGEARETRIVSSSLISTEANASVEEVERGIVDFLAGSRFSSLASEGWAIVPITLPVPEQSASRE